MVNEMDLFDPFKRMKKIRRRMFDMPETITGMREPLVDLVDSGKKLKLVAELPGIDKKDIDINVEENSISISGQKAQETTKQRKKEGYFFQERNFQSFFRKIPLPSEVIPGKANARMKNGILEIELPKRHPAKKVSSTKLKIE
jgi:HSP20 family protein